MPARHPLTRRTRRPAPVLRRLPAVALGLTALALAVPTTAVPASAAPPVHPSSGPSTGTPAGGSGTTTKRTTGRHLTAEAAAAGVEVGNAPMGWRQRGTQRLEVTTPRFGLARPGAVARSSSDDFTPKGVLGVDVSSYQGKLKWSTWSTKDRDFAYVKATEGTSYRNPYFKNQYRGAKKAGMVRGAYHFASPSGKAGYKQARYFVKNGGGWTPDGHTLPGVLDIEYNPYGSTCYGVSKKKMVKFISSFTREYKKLTGKDAVIYTTTDWWKRCTGNTDDFAQTNPLWIARYGTTKPGKLPKGWKTPTFWQYSANPIDQDVFPSKPARLKVLATKI